jgi:UDP-N-acetylmuramate--alanine ligase
VTTASGAKVRIVDDYGHHPSELAAVFAAARGGWPTSAWWWPSSRTATAAPATSSTISPRCCPSVDALVLSEVYPAGERRRRRLACAGPRHPRARPQRTGGGRQGRRAGHRAAGRAADGDLLLMMAGDIGAWPTSRWKVSGRARREHADLPPLRADPPAEFGRVAVARRQFQRARGVAGFGPQRARSAARAASMRSRWTAFRRCQRAACDGIDRVFNILHGRWR